MNPASDVSTAIGPLTALVLYLPVMYLSCFAHEVGHAVCARITGFAVGSFGVGLGRPWAVARIGQTRIYWCLQKPFQGITFWTYPTACPQRGPATLALAGGIIANGMLAVVAFALWRVVPWGGATWLLIAAVNGLLAFLSLMPYRVAVGGTTLRTDAMLIVELMRDRVIESSSPLVVQTLAAFRDLWSAVGDRCTLRSYLVWGAAARADVEDWAGAEHLIAEMNQLEGDPIPIQRAVAALVQCPLESHAGRFRAATAALDAAEGVFHSLRDEFGLILVAIERAELRMMCGDTDTALTELNRLAGHRLAQSIPMLRDQVLGLRVQACAAIGDRSTAAELLAEYEASRRRRRPCMRDLRVYRAVGRAHAQQQAWLQAERPFRQAVATISSVATLWSTAEEQRRFIDLQAPFLDEVRRCFHALDKPDEADLLIASITPPPKAEMGRAEAVRLRDRRLFRVAFWLQLVNIVCATLAILSENSLDPDLPRPEVIIVVGMSALCLIIALSYVLVYFTAGRFFSGLRRGGGLVLFSLACVPWITALVALASALLAR